MWIRTWDWTNCKFMGSTMITHWRITRLIYRLWYMTLPRSTWLMRLALTTQSCFMTMVPFLTHLVAPFSLGIRRFARVLNMIQLSPLEAYTMISQKGASWSWISLVQLSRMDASLEDAGYAALIVFVSFGSCVHLISFYCLFSFGFKLFMERLCGSNYPHTIGTV